MQVTIEISDVDAEVLKRWASVSRTLFAAIAVCEEYMTQVDSESVDYTRADICSEELRALEPALDRLHQTVRNQLWFT